MTNKEILIQTKKAYEILEDLKSNTEEYFLGIDEAMGGLSEMYIHHYNKEVEKGGNFNDITKGHKCSYCNGELELVDAIEIDYHCKNCDEYVTSGDLGHYYWEEL